MGYISCCLLGEEIRNDQICVSRDAILWFGSRKKKVILTFDPIVNVFDWKNPQTEAAKLMILVAGQGQSACLQVE